MKYIYGVFIIESLEDDEYFDGKVLEGILKLSGVKVEYRRVYDKKELKNQLEEFSEGGFRYLHISSHATDQTLNLSHDTVFYEEFEKLIENKVADKRIFLSACDAGNRNFASIIIRHGAYSVIGSPIGLRFDKAALFWASFFHVVNEIDTLTMKRDDINSVLKSCVKLFRIPINYYSFIKSNSNKMRRLQIRPDNRIDNRVINLKPYEKQKNHNTVKCL